MILPECGLVVGNRDFKDTYRVARVLQVDSVDSKSLGMSVIVVTSWLSSLPSDQVLAVPERILVKSVSQRAFRYHIKMKE